MKIAKPMFFYKNAVCGGAVAIWSLLPVMTLAQGGSLAALYAPDPPAGSAYVRVVYSGEAPIDVLFGSSSVSLRLPQVASGALASAYRVVSASQPPRLHVNGKPLVGASQPTAGSFVTWAITADASGGTAVSVVSDELPAPNALRAVLRLTNLVVGCNASLAQSMGGDVFSGLQTGQSKARLIQPARVNLVVRCGQATSAPFALPILQAGDRYSLFIVGTPQMPALKGQADATDPLNQ